MQDAMRAQSVQDSGSENISKYKLSDAVGLYSQFTSIINNLWTVYVAATFAASGFGISSSVITVPVASAVTLGFAAFAIGHFILLKSALYVAKSLSKQIKNYLFQLHDGSDPPFNHSLIVLSTTANEPWKSLSFHIFIDACVIVALWSRVDFHHILRLTF